MERKDRGRHCFDELPGDANASNHFYLPDEMPILTAPISRESFMIVVRALTALLVLLAAAPALAQDRRVPTSAAEVRLSYAPRSCKIAIRCSTIHSFAGSSACPASSPSRCSVRLDRA